MNTKDVADWLQACVDNANKNKSTSVTFYLPEIKDMIQALNNNDLLEENGDEKDQSQIS